MKPQKYGVFIGRFQPLHIGHIDLIYKTLNTIPIEIDKLIILIGSSNLTCSIKNPFSFEEREEMIRAEFKGMEHKIIIHPLRDYFYDELAWIERVKNILDYIVPIKDRELNQIKLIGQYKDKSSYYLKSFPYESSRTKYSILKDKEEQTISAATIRDSLFQDNPRFDLIPESTHGLIQQFLKTEKFKDLKEEYKYIQDYKSSWSASPYNPIFVTVDCVVEYDNKVLLIERREHPGKGKMALPGGFINGNETLEEAAIRELEEETKIISLNPEITPKIVQSLVFDYPERSSRGRVISHTFHLKITNTTLPKIKASDDAKFFTWVDINLLKDQSISSIFHCTDFHEDHYQILEKCFELK